MMANPIDFPSTTANLSLPLLFVGQAQKEPFINQAISIIDSVLQGTVEGSLALPPSDPGTGTAYRVLENASGEWSGHEDDIALWVGGAWNYFAPSNGFTIFDKAAQVQLRYDMGWSSAVTPAVPTGGNTVDTEARAAISELLDALRTAGILPNAV